LETDLEYSLISNVADNQNKFYTIPMDENYNPFSMVETPEMILIFLKWKKEVR